MSLLQLACRQCGFAAPIDSSMAGQSVICPTCGTAIVVPAGDAPAAPPPLPSEAPHAPPPVAAPSSPPPAAALEPLPWEAPAEPPDTSLASRILTDQYTARARKRLLKNAMAFALGIIALVVAMFVLLNVGK